MYRPCLILYDYSLQNFTTTDHIVRKITPEELIRTTRLITSATAKAVAAGKSCKQDDVITAANIGRKAITDVLNATKGAAAGADSPDIRQRALDSGRNLAVTYKELLDQVNLVRLISSYFFNHPVFVCIVIVRAFSSF